MARRGRDGMSDDEDTSGIVRGDRFGSGPARAFLSSLDVDRRIFTANLAVDRAHVVMLAEAGIIEEDVVKAILDGLAAIESDGYDALSPGEDVHEAIETTLVDRVGEAGEWLQTARSRNDEVATCLRVQLRADLLDLLDELIACRGVLLHLAGQHRRTVAPGYTHLQPAQPTTVAHWAASYEGALARDATRVLDCYARVNRSPLGAAAFAGTTFPVDRERTADLLGFDGLVENAADAVASRDAHLEAVGAATTLLVSLAGLAEDGIYFANRGYLDLGDDFASTSSIMPQKKNPDTLELVRAAAGEAVGGYTGLATTLKGLPRSYNRDLQSASRHLWRVMDEATAAIEVVTGALDAATWHTDALAADAGAGFSTATGVADRLTRAGVPFRAAHRVVAEAAIAVEDLADDDALENAIDGACREHLGVGVDELLGEGTVADLLDPMRSVEARDSRGGPAPSAVATALDRATDRLDDDRENLADRRQRLEGAADERGAAVARYR